MEGHAEADIGHAAVAGHDHHILGLITEPQSQSPTEPAGNGTLVPVVPIHEGDGRLGDGQTPAAGRPYRDGVLRIREGDHGQPNEQGHRAPGAHGMLLKNLLERAHLRDGHLLAERPVLHHVAIFLRHEFIEPRGKFDVIQTHLDCPPSVRSDPEPRLTSVQGNFL